MKKFHKIDPSRAKDNKNKCSSILEIMNQHLDNELYSIFKKSKSIHELDKNVEKLLEEYYTFGNKVMDYYGVIDEEDEE